MEEDRNQLDETSQPLRKIPLGSAKDVEFSEELADEEDREARERSKAANNRIRLDKKG